MIRSSFAFPSSLSVRREAGKGLLALSDGSSGSVLVVCNKREERAVQKGPIAQALHGVPTGKGTASSILRVYNRAPESS